MSRVLLVLSLLASLLFAGCASRTLSPEARASVRKVMVVRQVEMPEKPTVYGDGAVGAFLLAGPLALAAAQGMSDLPSQYKLALSTNNVRIDELTRQAVAGQLKSKGFEVVDREEQADAILKVRVHVYGLTKTSLSGDERVATMSTQFDLVRGKSNEVMWRQVVNSAGVIEIIEKEEKHSLKDFFNDGPLLKREHEKLTSLVAARAFRDL